MDPLIEVELSWKQLHTVALAESAGVSAPFNESASGVYKNLARI